MIYIVETFVEILNYFASIAWINEEKEENAKY